MVSKNRLVTIYRKSHDFKICKGQYQSQWTLTQLASPRPPHVGGQDSSPVTGVWNLGSWIASETHYGPTYWLPADIYNIRKKMGDHISKKKESSHYMSFSSFIFSLPYEYPYILSISLAVPVLTVGVFVHVYYRWIYVYASTQKKRKRKNICIYPVLKRWMLTNMGTMELGLRYELHNCTIKFSINSSNWQRSMHLLLVAGSSGCKNCAHVAQSFYTYLKVSNASSQFRRHEVSIEKGLIACLTKLS